MFFFFKKINKCPNNTSKVFTVMDPQGILEGIGKKLAGLDIGGTITTNIAKRQYVAAEQPACDAAFVRFGAVKQAASSIPFTEPNPNVDAEGVPTVTSNLLQNNIITQHTLDFEFPDPVGDYNIPDCDGRTLLGELCAVPKKDLDPCVAVQIVLDAGGKAQFPCSVTLFVGAAIMSVYRNTGELSNGTIIPARSVGETDDRSWMLVRGWYVVPPPTPIKQYLKRPPTTASTTYSANLNTFCIFLMIAASVFGSLSRVSFCLSLAPTADRTASTAMPASTHTSSACVVGISRLSIS